MNFEQLLTVRNVDAATLSELRRKALRNGEPEAKVSDLRDEHPEALHLAGYLGHQLVACASFYESSAPFTTRLSCWQMRFVGVHPSFQRQGYGSTLIRQSEGQLREIGVEQVWANARDTALGFYENLGWSEIPGSQHRSPPPLNLPHTVIYKVLSPRAV